MIKELEFLNANLNMAKKDVKQKPYACVYQGLVYRKVVNHCLSRNTISYNETSDDTFYPINIISQLIS